MKLEGSFPSLQEMRDIVDFLTSYAWDCYEQGLYEESDLMDVIADAFERIVRAIQLQSA